MKLSDTEIAAKAKEKFANLTLDWVEPENGDKYLVVPADKVDQVVQFLKDAPELKMDYLMSVSAFDASKFAPDRTDIEVTYHLYSYTHRHSLVLKARTPRGGAVNTVSHLYGCANFQEREVYDHFGITFAGHPDLRRLLLPDDWTGHPLLKDYQEQEEYRGIGTTRPSLL